MVLISVDRYVAICDPLRYSTKVTQMKLLNASCKRITRPRSEALIIYILMSCVSLLTVVLNLLVIVSIIHFRQLHTSTNLLLLSLAVSDFLVGLIVMPFQILLTEPCWFLGELTCTAFVFVLYITVCASVGNMVLISVDRYVAICEPLHYSTKVTRTKVKLCVLLSWVLTVFYAFMMLYGNLEDPGRFNSCYGECLINVNAAVDLVISFILPISAIIVLYVRVFVVAVSQARSMRSHIAAIKLQRSLTVTVQRSELKAARILGVVVVVFLMCYCPSYGISFSGPAIKMSSSTNLFFFFLVYFNSCLNPVIYAFFYPWFRKCVKLIAMLHILQPQSCLTNVM
ncbi:trace amine-associated receptor 13c-like [Betta splendens]|uniref:Trace amine-associated receptor 13c-like n=1 Tax=Betta splendens TaxID=158456 RepID=A0A6P7N4B2_BETSP|nr:trace amine-associated receptor 13c-like [Betta splendens]